MIVIKCRAKSDCTYLNADLALHSAPHKPIVAKGRAGNKTMINTKQINNYECCAKDSNSSKEINKQFGYDYTTSMSNP